MTDPTRRSGGTRDPSSLDVTIVDGYVDEPAHFGVPPYISTYPRYTAGALVDAGVPETQITYYTIDELREERRRWGAVADADLAIYIGGMTVPGKYVGGTPADPDEVREIAWTADGTSIMGGPVRFGVGDANEGGIETERQNLDFDFLAMADIETAVYDLVDSGLEGFNDRYRGAEELDRWASMGAFIVEQHPNHPEYLIAEMETSRGCAYRCSFCTEPMYGDPTFRTAASVVREVKGLYERGMRHFRIGRQADILAFGGDGEAPNPDALRRLYGGIREVAPNLRTLHLDNMNPVTITEYPERSREGIRVIAEHNTAGDTAAFGLESADPHVQEENNLLVSAEECLEAVRVLNEVAGWRPGESAADAPASKPSGTTRLPKLLPGINLLHGLTGEREETFAHNKRFLQRVYDEGLMVRRINIRQVMAFEGTEMEETGADLADNHKQLFKSYKTEVREEIDNPMLQRVAPPGTILPDVHLEYHQDGRTFGRQPGTYALLVAIPGERELGQTTDVAIVGHGYRSVTGVPHPLDLNSASMDELAALPKVGQSRAGDIIVNRPYNHVHEALDGSVDLDSFVTIRASGAGTDAQGSLGAGHGSEPGAGDD
ncbi:MAG: putative Fe-S oxidoreductase [uncultured archaeon A07HR60]|nr:MAG: putative Fe-S oxidoreductase [uncultured archaeon A07HR60]